MNIRKKGDKPVAKREQPTYNDQFGERTQQLLITMLLSDPDGFFKSRSILKDEYFDDIYRPGVRFILDYADIYKRLPSIEQVNAKSLAVKFEKFSEPQTHTQALLDEVEKFARYKAMEFSVLDGVELLQTGKAAEIVERVNAAIDITLSDETPFAMLWGDETDQVEPPVYLIEPWLVKDTVTCVYGAPGSFKSFFCLQAAFSLATGTDFAGSSVEKTNVVYVAAEGQSGITMRLDAIKAHTGIELRHTDMLLITESINLLDPESVAAYIRAIKKIEEQNSIHFGVHIIDTYSQCIAGQDENSTAVASAAAGSMIQIRRELATTVIYVHHTGKDASRGMRGADALRANTDGAIEVTRISETGMSASAVVKRAKDVVIGGRMDFEMKTVMVPRLHNAGSKIDSSLVCTFPATGSNTSTPMSRMVDQKTLRSIITRMEAGQEVSVGKAAVMIGMHDNPNYKRKIVDLMPLDQQMEVRDNGGQFLGVLTRKSHPTRVNDVFGIVVCQSKTPQFPTTSIVGTPNYLDIMH